MKFNKISLFIMLLIFSSHSFAISTDEWEYEVIKGDLTDSPGCKDRAKAEKKVRPGSYRFKNDAKFLCNSKGYGWSLVGIENEGELECNACEGDYEGAEKYRCRMKNVTIKCKQVKKGW